MTEFMTSGGSHEVRAYKASCCEFLRKSRNCCSSLRETCIGHGLVCVADLAGAVPGNARACSTAAQRPLVLAQRLLTDDSLVLCQDTGWYRVSMKSADLNLWGYKVSSPSQRLLCACSTAALCLLNG